MNSSSSKSGGSNELVDSKRIGFWLTEKKARQMKVDQDFAMQCRLHGLELVKVNLEEPLESQGPFSAIVHKISDLMVLGENGDVRARAACLRFQEYTVRHPETAIIDPLPNIRLLSNRYRMFKTIQNIDRERCTVFTPTFVELATKNVEDNLAKLIQHNVQFPLVCKPLPSHGSTSAHQMCLIFGPKGLRDVQVPCVAQTFVSHGAVLYKIFVVGDKHYVFERPSLKNFKPGDEETVFFNSHDVSKHPDQSSWLIKLDEEDAGVEPLRPDKTELDEISKLLQKIFGLDLLGIDVIVETATGRCAIIDVNTFPGYTEVDGLWEAMCQLVLSRIGSTRKRQPRLQRLNGTTTGNGSSIDESCRYQEMGRCASISATNTLHP